MLDISEVLQDFARLVDTRGSKDKCIKLFQELTSAKKLYKANPDLAVWLNMRMGNPKTQVVTGISLSLLQNR